MDTNSEMYQFIKKVNIFRYKHQIFNLDLKYIYHDDHIMAYTRGNTLIVWSNSDGWNQ